MKRLVSVVLIAVVVMGGLVGCSEPRIDGSTEEAMKVSISKVRESLPEPEREKFSKAMMSVAMDGMNLFEMAAAEAAGTGDIAASARTKLDGKTASEVIALAEKMAQERKARERQQALGEIKELETAMAKAEAAKAELAKFEVVKSRYYEKKSDWMTREIIELKVKNGTGQAISRAYFEGTLASPERSVPWAVDQFNYQIPGGLEPGEETTWTLNASYFDFANAGAPEDAIFTVVVKQVDGADGEPVASARGFDEDDRKRLSELKASYGAG